MKWTGQYGVHRLDLLNGRFAVVIDWDKGGYSVSCVGCTLKKRFQDLDSAKAASAPLVRRLLAKVEAELKESMEDG